MTVRELGDNVEFWLLGLLSLLSDGNFGDLTIGQFIFVAIIAGSFLFGTIDFVSKVLKEWKRGRQARLEIGCGLLFVVALPLFFGSGIGIYVAVGFALFIGFGLIVSFMKKNKDNDVS